MPDSVNLKKIDNRILDVISDLSKVRELCEDYNKDTSDDTLNDMVDTIERAGSNFEALKYTLAAAIKEINFPDEEEIEIVVKETDNGKEL